MPRDGSGIYSKASASFAANTTIASAAVNSDFDDLVADANAARPITAGGTGATTAVGAHDNLVGAGASIATAATLNLDPATGAIVDLTGTTGVTAVTLTAGRQRFGRATGAFTLTASASLIVNGSTSVNYTTTANDLLVFIGYAGGVVAVWTLTKLVSISGLMALAGNQTITGGFNATVPAITWTSFTVNPLTHNLQKATNSGAITITAPASDCVVGIMITNGASAGSITLSGFSVGSNTGDTIDTTNGHSFLLIIARINGVSTYAWKACQ